MKQEKFWIGFANNAVHEFRAMKICRAIRASDLNPIDIMQVVHDGVLSWLRQSVVSGVEERLRNPLKLIR